MISNRNINLSKTIIFILCCFIFLGYISDVEAEGSSSYNIDPTLGRMFINKKMTQDHHKTTIRVYAKPGEKIYLGSSSYYNDDADIIVTDPNGTVTNINLDALVRHEWDSTNINCSDLPQTIQAQIPPVDNTGIILDYLQEQAGPKPFNANGYEPYIINVATEGYYDIIFIPSNTTANGAIVKINSPFYHITNYCKVYSSSYPPGVGAWDVTVADSAGNIKNGRVFTDYYFFNHNSVNNATYQGYVLTDDGYVYHVNTGKINAVDWIFLSNNRGIIHSPNNVLGKTYYGSLQRCMLNSGGSFDRTNGYLNTTSTCNFTAYWPGTMDFSKNANGDVAYRIFISYPDADLLRYIGLQTPKQATEVTNISFTPDEHGGVFTFDTVEVGDIYIIDISVPLEGGGVEKLSFGGTTSLQNSVTWDGKDSQGNYIDFDSFESNITVKKGEAHFLFDDVERIEEGIQIQCLNCNSVTSPYTVYYNASQMIFEGDDNRMNQYINNVSTDMMMYNGNLVNAGNNSIIYLYGDPDQSAGIDSYSSAALRTANNYSNELTLNLWVDGNVKKTAYTYTRPTTMSISIRKIWVDENNIDGYRPSTVCVQLYDDEQPTEYQVELSGSGDIWNYTFPEVPISENYTIVETNINCP